MNSVPHPQTLPKKQSPRVVPQRRPHLRSATPPAVLCASFGTNMPAAAIESHRGKILWRLTSLAITVVSLIIILLLRPHVIG
jgi:hypothetical protein